MRKTVLAFSLTSILLLLALNAALASVTYDPIPGEHDWVLTRVDYMGQQMKSFQTICSLSSTPHTHYRDAYATNYFYICRHCAQTKTEYHESYGDMNICSLHDTGSIVTID